MLIAPSGRRFDPTETGEEVLRIAADIYGDISRLGTVVENRHDDVVGKIRILTVSGVQARHYDEFLADFHQTHPKIELEVEVMGSSNIISSLPQKKPRWASDCAVYRCHGWSSGLCFGRPMRTFAGNVIDFSDNRI